MNNMLLEKKLTQEEKAEILKELFGFYYEGDVLMDRYGKPFDFGRMGQDLFDTLYKIINYHGFISFKKGQDDIRHEVRKALGI